MISTLSISKIPLSFPSANTCLKSLISFASKFYAQLPHAIYYGRSRPAIVPFLYTTILIESKCVSINLNFSSGVISFLATCSIASESISNFRFHHRHVDILLAFEVRIRVRLPFFRSHRYIVHRSVIHPLLSKKLTGNRSTI